MLKVPPLECSANLLQAIPKKERRGGGGGEEDKTYAKRKVENILRQTCVVRDDEVHKFQEEFLGLQT